MSIICVQRCCSDSRILDDRCPSTDVLACDGFPVRADPGLDWKILFLTRLLAPLHSFGGDLEPDERQSRLGHGRGSSTAVSTPDEDDASKSGGSSAQTGTAAATAIIDVDAEPAGGHNDA